MHGTSTLKSLFETFISRFGRRFGRLGFSGMLSLAVKPALDEEVTDSNRGNHAKRYRNLALYEIGDHVRSEQVGSTHRIRG